MEPMDLDSEGPVHRYSSYRQASLSPPLLSPNKESDGSDMDVDSNSPVQDSGCRQTSLRWSVSLEHVSRAVGAIMSMRPSENPPADDNSAQMYPPMTSYKNWEPAVTVARGAVAFKRVKKTGYGLPDDETTFSHFPEYARDVCSESDSRQRLGGSADSPKSSHVAQNSWTDGLAAGQMSHRRGPPRKKLKTNFEDSDIGEREAQHSQCSCKRVCLWMIFIFIIGLSVVYISDYQKRKCEASRLFDRRSLEIDLESYIFGQHIASRVVPIELDAYFSRLNQPSVEDKPLLSSSGDSRPLSHVDQNCKPLVLSFHGGTGVGKTFMSRIVSANLMQPKLVQFVVPHLFPHKVYDEFYTQQIEKWIVGNVTDCRANIFVLDEMDKATPGVVSGIARAVSALSRPCHLASPVIVILLSNANAVEISRRYHSLHYSNPSSLVRAEISDSEFSDIFQSRHDNFVDVFVPFLPLEKCHITQCIRRDLVAKGFSSSSSIVEKILDELSFSSLGDLHLSITGCKRVMDKVDYVMMQINSQ